MLWLLLACTVAPQTQDSGADDSGAQDTGTRFEPLDGHGTLSGDCNALDDGEWDSDSPFSFRNTLDLLEGFEDEELLEQSQIILSEGNLNSGSLYSEIFAFEAMARCEPVCSRPRAKSTTRTPTEKRRTCCCLSMAARWA